MTTKLIKLSEIRKRLAATLDNVTKSNSQGMQKAQLHLQTLESDLQIRPAAQHHEQILGLVLSARAALGMGRLEDTELLLGAGIKMAEKTE